MGGGQGQSGAGSSQGVGAMGGWPVAPPPHRASSLAAAGIIMTSHSGHYCIPVDGFLYID